VKPLIAALSLISALVLAPAGSSALELGINIYGASYHPDRTDALGNPFNEYNPGLGLNLIVSERAKTVAFFEGGLFIDSFEQEAKYISFGYQYKFFEFLRLGINTGLYHTRSVNYGNPVIAPVPALSLHFDVTTLNFIYFPSFGGLNWYDSIGAYATFHIFRTN
jgi:hypothetical protein